MTAAVYTVNWSSRLHAHTTAEARVIPGAGRPSWSAVNKRTRKSADMEPDRNILSAAHFLEEGAALRHVAVPSGVDSILYGHLLGAFHFGQAGFKRMARTT